MLIGSRALAVPAVAHRVVLDYRARLDGVTSSDVVREVLATVGELEEKLPDELEGTGDDR